MKRFLPFIVLLLCAFTAQAQGPTRTTITDTLYGPDGNLGNGTIVISNPTTFTSADGYVIVANTQTIATVTTGALSVALVPNAGSTPSGTYYVANYNINGGRFTEYWIIPSSGSPVRLSAVRTLTPPSLGLIASFNQLNPPNSSCVNQFPEWTSSGWTCASPSGTFTAGGDLSGTSSSQNVIGMHFGSNDYSLSSTALSSGQCIGYNGTNILGVTCGSGGMTWPSGTAGIPNYSGASSWGTTYNASNLIPANFISTLNQNTTGNAATATALASYTAYSVYGSGASTGSWITPTANGQCLMSAASSYATTIPSFQSCPSGGGGLSGMTAGQIPVAATATTVTSSMPLQGTDSKILTSGTISGSSAVLICTDANGGATTSGCPSGSVSAPFSSAVAGGTATAGNASLSNFTWTFSLSGGTNPTINFSNDLVTFNTPIQAYSISLTNQSSMTLGTGSVTGSLILGSGPGSNNINPGFLEACTSPTNTSCSYIFPTSTGGWATSTSTPSADSPATLVVHGSVNPVTVQTFTVNPTSNVDQTVQSSNTFVAMTTTAAAVSSDVATLTFGSNPTTNFSVGGTVTVSGFTGSDTYFNGIFVLTGTSSSTISYALTHANASATSSGSVIGDPQVTCGAPNGWLVFVMNTAASGTMTLTPSGGCTLNGSSGALSVTAGYATRLISDSTNLQAQIISNASGAGTGTVTSFSAGNLSPLFTTSVATATTTPALTFSLSNAGAYTLFGNNSASSAAPSFTATPAVTSLALEGSTSGSALLSASATGGTLNLGSTNATVTSAGALTVASCTGCGGGGSTALNSILSATAANTPITNGNYNQTWEWSLTGSTDAFDLAESAASTGTGSLLGIKLLTTSTADGLTISAAGSSSGTFGSGLNALNIINPTAATSSQNQPPPPSDACGYIWNGASVADCITKQVSYTTGTNPAVTYTIGHTGSTGAFKVALGTLIGSTSGLGLSPANSSNTVNVQTSSGTPKMYFDPNNPAIDLADQAGLQAYTISYTNTSGGTLNAGELVKLDTSNADSVVACTTSDTTACFGFIKGTTASNTTSCAASAKCDVAVAGEVITPLLGTGTCSIGQYIVPDTTTTGDVKCSATAGPSVGVADSAQSTVGSAVHVTVFYNPTAAGSGSGNMSDGSGSSTAGYFPETTTTAHTYSVDTNLQDVSGTLTYSGTIAAAPSGGKAGALQLTGNTTEPSLGSNVFAWIAPNSASFTSWGAQMPSAGPSAASIAEYGTLSSAISSVSFLGVQGSGDSNVLLAGTVSGTGSTLCTDSNGGATTSGCSSGGTPSFPLTVAGTVTSGGIPYFNSTTQESSSALLAANDIVVGGGAGTAPSTDASASLSAGTLSLGASGTLGAVKMGNATSGTVTLEPVTGALGTVTASLPANTGTIAELNLAQTFSALQTFGTDISIGGVTAAGATGTGNVVFATSPTLTTPNLGTPSALTLTNATGLPCAALPALTGGATSSAGNCATTVTFNTMSNPTANKNFSMGNFQLFLSFGSDLTSTGLLVEDSTNDTGGAPLIGGVSALGSANATAVFSATGSSSGTFTQPAALVVNNVTAATSSQNQPSPQSVLCGYAWEESTPASEQDCGVFQYTFASGSNPTATLALTRSTPGTNSIIQLLVSGVVDGKAPVTPITSSTFTFGTTGGSYLSGYYDNINSTTTTAVTGTLPTAAAGIQYCIDNSNNGTSPDTGALTIQTSASGQYIEFTDGTYSASDGYVVSGGAARDSACVRGIDSSHWMLYVYSGTWTKH